MGYWSQEQQRDIKMLLSRLTCTGHRMATSLPVKTAAVKERSTALGWGRNKDYASFCTSRSSLLLEPPVYSPCLSVVFCPVWHFYFSRENSDFVWTISVEFHVCIWNFRSTDFITPFVAELRWEKNILLHIWLLWQNNVFHYSLTYFCQCTCAETTL